MAFNVSDFRGKLQQGGARANMFEVIVTNPPGAQAGLNVEQMSFMCKAAALPASRVGAIDVPYFGRTIKLAGDREFDPWTITVINDETFDLKDALERWQGAVASYSTGTNNQRNAGATSNPFSYVADITINQYGKEGEVVKSVKLVNAHPVEIGEIALAWDANNQIEEFTVQWNYDYFESNSNV